MRSLTLREKLLIILAFGLSAVVLAVQVVILPALASRQQSLTQLGRFEAVLSVLDVVPVATTEQSAPDLPPLRSRVTETAGLSGLDIRRIDPQGQALSVSLDDAAFPALIGWLDHLTGVHMVGILSAEIGRRPEPGIVSARFLLEAK